jgi:hypothetical protein
MSEEAMRGLRAAVEYNPEAARFLLNALRGLPIGVRYKPQDRYGPLGMMILAFAPTLQVTDKVSIQRKVEPFPENWLHDCEIFNEEWLQRSFTKQELANAIESILNELNLQPMLEQVPPDTTLIFRADGTFLHDPNGQAELFKKLE